MKTSVKLLALATMSLAAVAGDIAHRRIAHIAAHLRPSYSLSTGPINGHDLSSCMQESPTVQSSMVGVENVLDEKDIRALDEFLLWEGAFKDKIQECCETALRGTKVMIALGHSENALVGLSDMKLELGRLGFWQAPCDGTGFCILQRVFGRAQNEQFKLITKWMRDCLGQQNLFQPFNLEVPFNRLPPLHMYYQVTKALVAGYCESIDQLEQFNNTLQERFGLKCMSHHLFRLLRNIEAEVQVACACYRMLREVTEAEDIWSLEEDGSSQFVLRPEELNKSEQEGLCLVDKIARLKQWQPQGQEARLAYRMNLYLKHSLLKQQSGIPLLLLSGAAVSQEGSIRYLVSHKHLLSTAKECKALIEQVIKAYENSLWWIEWFLKEEAFCAEAPSETFIGLEELSNRIEQDLDFAFTQGFLRKSHLKDLKQRCKRIYSLIPSVAS